MVIAVIPAHNEEKNIKDVIKKTQKFVNKIIVVNDGSTDCTREIAQKTKAIVLTHKINLGLGGTLKTGCDAALKLKADIIITIDGDGQHNPSEIPQFLKKIRQGYDIVFGARSKNKKAMPLLRKLGNDFSSKFQNLLFNSNLSDIQTGYRAFTAKAYKKIRWEASGYNVASEIAINTQKAKLNYCEIPIDTIYKDAYKGITPIDGIQIFADLLIKRLSFK